MREYEGRFETLLVGHDPSRSDGARPPKASPSSAGGEPTSPAGTIALAYAARGYFVFPCRADKTPFTPHGFKDASVDPTVVRNFWRTYPDAQIGIDCGRSGIVVVDLDKKKGVDGTKAFEELRGAKAHGCGLIASTPSGGLHYIYAAPDGTPIKNTAGRVAPGIDTRAQGGYVLAPSPASPGRQWVAGDWLSLPPRELPQPPDWLLALLPRKDEKRAESAVATTPRSKRAGVGVKLDDVWNGAPLGQRNSAAAHIAGTLLAHGLRQEVWPLLVAWNEKNGPPLTETELRCTYESVLRGDQQRHPERHASLLDPPWVRQTLDELLATKPQPWVIQNYFRAGQLGFVCAFPTVGKSTLAASWIMATLYGRDWAGRRVRGGSVVVLAGEGRRGFANRLDAYRRHHGLGKPPEDRYIEIVDFKLPLSSSEGQAAVRLLIETITKERGHAPTLVVIDTLSSHWAESEDSAEFGAPAMRALADIAQDLMCAIVIVHHVTKVKGARAMPDLSDLRGTSSFAGNSDFVFAMCATQDGKGALLDGLKLKDDERPPVIELRRISVPLDRDDEGQPASAALFEPQPVEGTPFEPLDLGQVEREAALKRDVERIVDALRQLGVATRIDAVVAQAGLKAQRGRACFDVAMSKQLIRNEGSGKKPRYLLATRPPEGGGVEKEAKRGRDVGDVPVVVPTSGDVRDAMGRRDVTKTQAGQAGAGRHAKRAASKRPSSQPEPDARQGVEQSEGGCHDRS